MWRYELEWNMRRDFLYSQSTIIMSGQPMPVSPTFYPSTTFGGFYMSHILSQGSKPYALQLVTSLLVFASRLGASSMPTIGFTYSHTPSILFRTCITRYISTFHTPPATTNELGRWVLLLFDTTLSAVTFCAALNPSTMGFLAGYTLLFCSSCNMALGKAKFDRVCNQATEQHVSLCFCSGLLSSGLLLAGLCSVHLVFVLW